MTRLQWFRLTGENLLAVGRMWSIQFPRKKSKPHHPQRWRGAGPYEYGVLPPRYPVPAIPVDCRFSQLGLAADKTTYLTMKKRDNVVGCWLRESNGYTLSIHGNYLD